MNLRKLYTAIALSSLVMASTSCKKYLDINNNPNAATSSTPELTLSNALTVTAQSVVTYNTFASTVNGYAVNAGGYGGFGSTFTYSYANNSNTGLWTNLYDNLEDYQYIIDQSAGKADYVQFVAIAKIMQAYDYHRLVDYYGDIPYTEALKGEANLVPKYDKAETVYQSLITSLDQAIATLTANPSAARLLQSSDVVFGSSNPAAYVGSGASYSATNQITFWKNFANTLKLRLLNRIQGVASLSAFATSEYATLNNAGFITNDVTVNPGFSQTNGKQNPAFESYVASASGAASGNGRQYIASNYVISFYNGTKIADDTRGALTYRSYPTTPVGQLSSPNNPVAPTSPNPVWYTGNGTGIIKGITASQPLMLLAEKDFLQAEAALNGKYTGNPETFFENGIKDSYTYLSKNAAGTGATDADAYLIAYKAANPGNYRVIFSLGNGNAQKLEAIITQKYIALNFIDGAEAFTEYRRTAYPSIVIGSTSATETFVSPQSTSTRPDRLPVRLPYPDTEYQLNAQNVPQGINVFTSRIFWDLN